MATAVLVASTIVLGACDGGEGTTEEATDSGGGPAEGEELSLRFSSFVAEGPSVITEVTRYLEAVEEQVSQGNHHLEIEKFYGGTLLGPDETLDGARDGRTDLGYAVIHYHPGELPLSQIVGAPFITDDPVVQFHAMNHLYESSETYRAEWDSQGLRPLLFPPNAPGIIATSEPVHRFDDLLGLSLRADGLLAHAVDAAGANPAAISFPETFEAVQRGVIEGTTTVPFDSPIAVGMHEVMPHFADPGIGLFALSALVVSNDTWDTLPDSVRGAFTEDREAYLEAAIAGLEAENDARCTEFLEAGGEPFVWPEEETARWREVAQDASLERWRENAVSAGVPAEDVEEFEAEYLAAIERFADQAAHVTGTASCAERAADA